MSLPGPSLGGPWSVDLLPNWLFPNNAKVFADASPLVDHEDPGWGAIIGGNAPEAWVQRVQVRMDRSELVPSGAEGDRGGAPGDILDRLSTWRGNLLLWAEALTGYPCRHREPSGYLNSLPFWTEIGAVSGPRFGPAIKIGPVDGDLIEGSGWTKIVQAAVAGPPPVSWTMLVDARAFMARGDFRRAVIDAGVAVDLALSQELSRRFHAEAQPFESLLTHKVLNQGLGTLIDAFQRVRRQFRSQDDMNTLKRARNAAAHDGVAPSEAEAQTSVRLAQEVLSEIDPLETHLVLVTPQGL